MHIQNGKAFRMEGQLELYVIKDGSWWLYLHPAPALGESRDSSSTIYIWKPCKCTFFISDTENIQLKIFGNSSSLD